MTVRKELVSWCFEPSQLHRVVAYQTNTYYSYKTSVRKDTRNTERQYEMVVQKDERIQAVQFDGTKRSNKEDGAKR